MPALNFQPRFADPVRSGAKPLTLRMPRRDGRDAAPVGKRLRLYTGMRRPDCALLLETVTLYRVTLQLGEGGIVSLTGARGGGALRPFMDRWLCLQQAPARDQMSDAFARLDGFDSYADLFAWHAAVALDDIGCVTRELINWRTP